MVQWSHGPVVSCYKHITEVSQKDLLQCVLIIRKDIPCHFLTVGQEAVCMHQP